jgi:hypothetical protein
MNNADIMDNQTGIYDTSKIEVKPSDDGKPGRWKFRGKGNVRGTRIRYDVTDDTVGRLKKWVFEVRVPDRLNVGNYIEVRPVEHPQRKCWAGIERTTLTFAKATLEGFRGLVYSKISLADPTGLHNTKRVSGCNLDRLPTWMTQFNLHLKDSVKSTKGTDGESCVAVFAADDYKGMINFYFAVKVWVLKEGFVLED